jgi:hypothetical protein
MMILHITIILSILSAMITVVAFVLYIGARMAVRVESSESEGVQPGDINSELDRKERLYRSIHFISLSIFVLLGVLILVQLSSRLPAAS